MRDFIARARVKLQRHGAVSTLHELALRTVNSYAVLKMLRAIAVVAPAAEFLVVPEGFSAGILAESAIREFARDPATQMAPEFVDEALARGDQCYALVDRGVLAAYG